MDSEPRPWGSRHAVGENTAPVHRALPWVSYFAIQNLRGDALHSLMFDIPGNGSLVETCWIPDRDIGAGKQKRSWQKGIQGIYTKVNPEKEEGRETEAAG